MALRGTDYALGQLMWSDLKLEIQATFCDINRELKLFCYLAGLSQTTSVAAYTKDFHHIALELGNQIPNDVALLFMYVEELKLAVQIQVLFLHSNQLVDAKQLVEQADMAFYALFL